MVVFTQCPLIIKVFSYRTLHHHTLENFDQQKDLSCHQAHWMEFLSQYDHHICYIKGENNCVVDTLSIPPNIVDNPSNLPIAPTLSICSDMSLLDAIIAGYTTDLFCHKLKNTEKSIDGIHWLNSLLYIRDQLVILCT